MNRAFDLFFPVFTEDFDVNMLSEFVRSERVNKIYLLGCVKSRPATEKIEFLSVGSLSDSGLYQIGRAHV